MQNNKIGSTNDAIDTKHFTKVKHVIQVSNLYISQYANETKVMKLRIRQYALSARQYL